MTPEDIDAFLKRVRDEYNLTPGEEVQLSIAEEALDTYRQILAKISAEGLTVEGRWGNVAHPLLGPLARARDSVMKAIKLLDFQGAA